MVGVSEEAPLGGYKLLLVPESDIAAYASDDPSKAYLSLSGEAYEVIASLPAGCDEAAIRSATAGTCACAPRLIELSANIDAWTRRLWRTSQDGRMVIKCAGQVQQVAEEMREAAGLEEDVWNTVFHDGTPAG
jgi:hypothetical protein